MSTFDSFLVVAYFGSPFFVLTLGYVAGKIAEHRHYKSIRRREHGLLNTPTVTWKTLTGDRPIRSSELAVGSVVISVDHYKRFLMAFRRIFGGESYAYATVIDRGRREAILRMKESSPDAHLFLNARLETATISNGRGKSVGTAEVLAYATAVTFADVE